MKYTVEYVETKNGKRPFEEFVMNLPIDERARIFETINYFLELKNGNLPVKENISKHLEDGIFELRTTSANRIVRSIYFYHKGAKIVLTHGFVKKGEKAPRKEIERAKELRALYHVRKETI